MTKVQSVGESHGEQSHDETAARAIAALRQWCAAGQEALTAARAEIDALNVYPVPDGDTGTNLLLTMESVVAALDEHAQHDLPAAAAAMAHGALLGARGNSGVILSQLLRGVADVLTSSSGDDSPTDAASEGDVLAAAMARASELGYAAVAHPVEGTVLTVARAAAAAAAAAAQNDPHDPVAVARTAADAAHEALAHTPEQLPVLATAGVVDAGGHGLCLLLDALVAVMTGQPLPSRPAPSIQALRTERNAVREAGSAEFGYEVQFLLDASDAAVEVLRAQLDPLGDSLVVVGGEGLWNVHVHVNDPGAAMECGVEAGRPHRITITRFVDQMGDRDSAQDTATGTPVVTGTVAAGAVVAVVSGHGLAEVYRSAGAIVVDGGPTHNPATRDLLAAVAGVSAEHVVLLPNHGNIRGVAEQAAAAADGRLVSVVPTRSPLQGLAALAVHDPALPAADNVEAMTDAALATQWAELTYAVRAAQTDAGTCQPGDVLGLVAGEVTVIGSDLFATAVEILEQVVGPASEILTVALGEEAPTGLGSHLTQYVAARWPSVSIEVLTGDQPHYPLLLAVE